MMNINEVNSVKCETCLSIESVGLYYIVISFFVVINLSLLYEKLNPAGAIHLAPAVKR